MKTKFGFFPYMPLDYKAAQAYLDRKAEQGWVLKDIWFQQLALFEPAQGRRHFVELWTDRDPDRDYLQLCADAGWESLQSIRGMLLFRSLPGIDPAPIQSDRGLEWKQFLKRYVWREMAFSGVYLLLLIFLLWCRFSIRGFALSTLVTFNGSLFYCLILACELLLGIWVSFHALHYLLRCRAAGKLVAPGRLSVVLRNTLPSLLIIFLLVIVALFCFDSNNDQTVELRWRHYDEALDERTATTEACQSYPIVTALDLGVAEPSYRDLDGRRSWLVDFLGYQEIAEEGIVTTERYACTSQTLAQWVVSQRKKETGRQHGFTWGILDWQETPGLGFDESYTCREGSYLLLRQGNIVALVGCGEVDRPVRDLTTPESLTIIRTRLGL